MYAQLKGFIFAPFRTLELEEHHPPALQQHQPVRPAPQESYLDVLAPYALDPADEVTLYGVLGNQSFL